MYVNNLITLSANELLAFADLPLRQKGRAKATLRDAEYEYGDVKHEKRTKAENAWVEWGW